MIKINLAQDMGLGSNTDLLEYCKTLLDEYISNSREPRKAKLKSIKGEIVSCYDQYWDSKANLASISKCSWPADDIETLSGCYKSGGSIDRDILDKVRNEREFCPYCGLRLPPKPNDAKQEADHYLPISIFPEYSILLINLIASCHDCNNSKRAIYENGGQCAFLHPYFDESLKCQLVEASVRASQKNTFIVEFNLTQQALSHPDTSVIRSHIAKLDLLKRFSYAGGVGLDMIVSSQAHAPDITVDILKGILIKTSQPYLNLRPNDPIGLALIGASKSNDLPKVWNELVRKLKPNIKVPNAPMGKAVEQASTEVEMT